VQNILPINLQKNEILPQEDCEIYMHKYKLQ